MFACYLQVTTSVFLLANYHHHLVAKGKSSMTHTNYDLCEEKVPELPDFEGKSYEIMALIGSSNSPKKIAGFLKFFTLTSDLNPNLVP